MAQSTSVVSKLLPAIRSAAKLGIVGCAVYWTTTTGVWSQDTTQNAVAIRSLTEDVDKRLGREYLTKISLPSSDTVINTWNSGVTKTFDVVAAFPDKVSDKYSDAKAYIKDMNK